MSRYAIRVEGKSFISRNAVFPFDEQFGHSPLTNYVKTPLFNSLEEAKKAWKEKGKAAVKKWDPKIKISEVEFLEAPSKGLPLKEGEIELFSGIEDNPYGKYPTWDRFAIKEIGPKEALELLANFNPSPDHYRYQPRLYFWDNKDKEWGTGGFYDSWWGDLYGYDYETRRFITTNYSECYFHKEHAGAVRTIDSSYQIPLYLDDKLGWYNLGTLRNMIKYEGLDIDRVKPAFETSLDVDDFIKKLKEEL